MSKDEKTSMVDREEYERDEAKKEMEKQAKRQDSDSLKAIALMLGSIVTYQTSRIELQKESNKLIKENTDAINSLLTILVSDQPQRKAPATFTTDPTTPTSAPATPLIPQVNDYILKAKGLFTEDLEAMLNFTDEGEYIKLKPIAFLGADNFAKIASIVRNANGEYVSAGKASHFRIKK